MEPTVLECPGCMKDGLGLRTVAGERMLSCASCGYTVRMDGTTGFFDLRMGARPDGATLLVHEAEDFYANEVFMRCVLSLNILVLRRVLGKCRPAVVLDIGCGNGGYSTLFHEEGAVCYYGLEPSDIPARKVDSRIPEMAGQVLVHDDLEKPLPIMDRSVDMVCFLSSYDHVPERGTIITDAWRKLKPGGFLLINMTNYGFWVKRILNRLFGGRRYAHEDAHVCVHDTATLAAEIRSYVPDADLFWSASDYVFVPNLPKTLAPFYFHKRWVSLLNGVLRLVFTRVLRLQNQGSVMTVVFSKPR